MTEAQQTTLGGPVQQEQRRDSDRALLYPPLRHVATETREVTTVTTNFSYEEVRSVFLQLAGFPTTVHGTLRNLAAHGTVEFSLSGDTGVTITHTTTTYRKD